MTSRRGFLKGIAALAAAGAAPGLIREGLAMPVKPELSSSFKEDYLASGATEINDSNIKAWIQNMHEVLQEQQISKRHMLGEHYYKDGSGVLADFPGMEATPASNSLHWPIDDTDLKINNEVVCYGTLGEIGPRGDLGYAGPPNDWTVQVERWNNTINQQRVKTLGVAHVPGSMLDFPSHPSYTAGHGGLEDQALKEFRKRYPG